jgi:hypothetical protein
VPDFDREIAHSFFSQSLKSWSELSLTYSHQVNVLTANARDSKILATVTVFDGDEVDDVFGPPANICGDAGPVWPDVPPWELDGKVMCEWWMI